MFADKELGGGVAFTGQRTRSHIARHQQFLPFFRVSLTGYGSVLGIAHTSPAIASPPYKVFSDSDIQSSTRESNRAHSKTRQRPTSNSNQQNKGRRSCCPPTWIAQSIVFGFQRREGLAVTALGWSKTHPIDRTH